MMNDDVRESVRTATGQDGDIRSVDLNREEWGLVSAWRQLADEDRDVDLGQKLEPTLERLEQDLFERARSTLDRMLANADQASRDLDVLLQRLAETSPARRSMA